MGKQLNLKWVSDVIGESYKEWKDGNIILIQAQTGTGKTVFILNTLIPYLKDKGRRALYVCNRKALVSQVKIDLLKQFNMPKPILETKDDIEAFEKIHRIGNVTILSYQFIQGIVNDSEYGGDKFDIDKYDYVICDEVHYLTVDSSFNPGCRLAVDLLLKQYSPHIVKILISATMVQIKDMAIKFCQQYVHKVEPIVYETGEDYSYIRPVIMSNKKDILKRLIVNDKTDHKWVIFVIDIEDRKSTR